jgi:threonine/homoserine/homoserine lactone efflux protein
MLSESEWVALLALAAATSFTPGPNTALSATLGAQGGLRLAWPFIFSVPVGWGLLFGICTAGLGSLLMAAPGFRWSIVLLGTAYLLWLSWRLWATQTMGAAAPIQVRMGFLQGVALQFVNIKAWFLALSVVAGWVAGQPDPVGRFVWVLPVLLIHAFASNFLYAWVGARLKSWLSGPFASGEPTFRRLQCYNRGMATVLLLTAGWMVMA